MRGGASIVAVIAGVVALGLVLTFFWQLLTRSSQQHKLQDTLSTSQQAFTVLSGLLERDLAACDRIQAGPTDLLLTTRHAGTVRQVTYTFLRRGGVVRRQDDSGGASARGEVSFASHPDHEVEFALEYQPPREAGQAASLTLRATPVVAHATPMLRSFGFVPGRAGSGLDAAHRNLDGLLAP